MFDLLSMVLVRVGLAVCIGAAAVSIGKGNNDRLVSVERIFTKAVRGW